MIHFKLVITLDFQHLDIGPVSLSLRMLAIRNGGKDILFNRLEFAVEDETIQWVREVILLLWFVDQREKVHKFIEKNIILYSLSFPKQSNHNQNQSKMSILHQNMHFSSFYRFYVKRDIIITAMNVIEKGIKVNQKYNEAEQYAKKL